MGVRATSAAARDLADRCAAEGVSVSPRQIERWRQLGLLPSSIRRGLGRGRGSVSRYPDQALGLVLAIARARHGARRLDERALAIFMAGEPVTDRGLRWAYASVIDRMAETIDREGGSGDALDRAEAIVAAEPAALGRSGRGREMRRRLRGRGESVESLMQSVWTNMFLPLLGGTPHPDALAEVGAAYGVEEGAEFLSAIGAPALELDLDGLGRRLSAVGHSDLAAAARNVARAQIDEARAVFVRFTAFADDWSVVLRRAAGIDGKPGLAALPRPIGEAAARALAVLAFAALPNDIELMSNFLDDIRPNVRLFAALRELIDALPADLAPLLIPNELDRDAKENPERVTVFNQALDRYCEAHPNHRQILLSPAHLS